MTASWFLAHFRIFAHLDSWTCMCVRRLYRKDVGHSRWVSVLALGGDDRGQEMRLLVTITLSAATRHVALLGRERQHELHPPLQQVGGTWRVTLVTWGPEVGTVGARRAIKQAAHACRGRRGRLLIGSGVSPPAGHMEGGYSRSKHQLCLNSLWKGRPPSSGLEAGGTEDHQAC
jgi:hypothetical protein